MFKYFRFIVILALGFLLGSLTNEIYRDNVYGNQTIKNSQLPTVSPSNLNADKLFELTNNWRVQQGYQPYIKNQTLCNLAKIRLNDIYTNWSHDGFVETVKWWFGNRQYDVSENLAKDMSFEKQTLQKWLNSPTHKENLVKNYKYSCIAAKGGYAVQLFGNF
jgi:uncharacterized protein YkwD